MDVVNPSNFNQICSVLFSEDDYSEFVYSIVQYYSICLVIDSSSCDDIQLDLLIKTLTEQNILNEPDCNEIKKQVNTNFTKACLLNTLHSKPINCTLFFDILHKAESLEPLQSEIYRNVTDF